MNPFKENKILRFLGSVKLALPMLLILAALLATGTIVESRFSTAVAKRFVYGTWWFGGFLMLLAVNLFCSAFSRFPWKKYQTGFVITHLGIILLLAGSLITQQLGKDGQIALKEGAEGHVFQEENPTLLYQVNDGPINALPASFPFRAPSPDHPLMVHLPGDGLLMVDQFYLNAQRMVTGRNAEKGEKGFPALRLKLDSSFVHEDQWLFLGGADNGGFDGLTAGKLDLGPASAFFEKEGDWKKDLSQGAKDVPDNALALLLAPDGSLKYQTRFHGKFDSPQPLALDTAYATGWMDMQFTVPERLDNALPEETYESQPFPYQKDLQPALHYEVLKGAATQEGWLGYQSAPVSFTLSQGQTFALAYGPQQIDLPFMLHLVKFKVGFDPGTDKPASYASDIFYMDPVKGVQAPAHITMNEPLHFMGYTVYQASYEAEPDGSYVSVFSVGKDPGIWMKYGGAIVLVLGIIFMFWFKNPAWNKRETDEQGKF